MRNCPTEPRLAAYVADACPGDEAAMILDHVSRCPRCAEQIEDFKADESILAGVRCILEEDSRLDFIPDDPTQRLERPRDTEPARSTVGLEGYDVLDEIGRGGMGTVYRAFQHSTRRQVALKVLHGGNRASEAAKARFRREVEVAASLQHPYIVTILDSGIHREGYYLAMELVRGVRVDRSVADRKLPTHETLRLFRKVCDAVAFAHKTGVLHRDLKPSNILVDESGDPRVLDFGIAKIMRDAASDERTLSAAGELIGSLPYMSPEQAGGSSASTDARSDVYSLGVILFELLAGRRPYELPSDSIPAAVRIISEQPPVRLGVADRRLGGDLDSIVAKALEKDAAQRYPTVEALAEDLDRYLTGRPVSARRHGRLYRLRKLASRRKAGVLVVGLGFALLVSVGLVLDRGRQADSARVGRLVSSAQALIDQRHWVEAVKLFEEAVQLAPSSAPALCGLANLKKDLFNQKQTDDPSFSDRTLLLEGQALCERALATTPNHSDCLNAYGVVLKKLGRFPEAAEAYRRATQVESNVPHWWNNLGEVQALMGDLPNCELNLRQAVRVADSNLPDHSFAWRDLASYLLFRRDQEAVTTIEQAVRCNADDRDAELVRARVLLELGTASDFPSALDAAKLADRPGCKLAEKAKRVRAWAHLRHGDFDEAAKYARLAMEGGDLHSVNHLIAGIAKAWQGDGGEARRMLEAAESEWAAELKKQDYLVSAEKGVLWFDTAAAFELLRDEARSAVGPPE